MCPFSFLQTTRKIPWSKGDNSNELSNFDSIVKIKKNADCRKKEKKKGGDEEGRCSLFGKFYVQSVLFAKEIPCPFSVLDKTLACNNKCYLPAKLYLNDFNEISV